VTMQEWLQLTNVLAHAVMIRKVRVQGWAMESLLLLQLRPTVSTVVVASASYGRQHVHLPKQEQITTAIYHKISVVPSLRLKNLWITLSHHQQPVLVPVLLRQCKHWLTPALLLLVLWWWPMIQRVLK
jgi:hypothetical protein